MPSANFFHTNLNKTIDRGYDEYLQQQIREKQVWITRAKEHALNAQNGISALQVILDKTQSVNDIERLPLIIANSQHQLDVLYKSIIAAEEDVARLLESEHLTLHSEKMPL